MRFGIATDARPQAVTLLLAAAISVALWFVPYAEFVTYPFRLFVTFIHEGGHAIAAVLTGNAVQSLSVAANASGETYTTQGSLFSQIFIASAGYVGAMTFGALLLVLIREAVAARLVLIGSAAWVLCLTLYFGVFKPLVAGGSPGSIPFTLAAGVLLSAGLIALARFAGSRMAAFFVSFLAVQCVLNALLDLKTVFFLSSPLAPSAQTDAQNMADATHIPAVVWTVVWIAMAIVILGVTMLLYVATKRAAADA